MYLCPVCLRMGHWLPEHHGELVVGGVDVGSPQCRWPMRPWGDVGYPLWRQMMVVGVGVVVLALLGLGHPSWCQLMVAGVGVVVLVLLGIEQGLGW